MRVGRVRGALGAAAQGPGPVVVVAVVGRGSPPPPGVLVLGVVVVSTALAVAAPHPHVTADPHAASLLGDDAAERGALGQAGELLGAVDDELLRLDLHAEVERASGGRGHARDGRLALGVLVLVLVLLGLLVQVEGQLVAALVPDRQVRKEEVAGLERAVQVRHARDGHPREHGRRVGRGRRAAGVGHDAGVLEGGEEEEVGIVDKGDVLVLSLLPGLALVDAQLHDGRRVHGASVGGCCKPSVPWFRRGEM